jgi:hypothetical protein
LLARLFAALLKRTPPPARAATGDLFAQALAFTREGRLDEAIERYRALLAAGPASAPVLNNLAIVHQRLGNLPAAEAALAQAIALDPGLAEAQINLANTRQDQGRLREALAAYENALRVDPARVEARYGRATTLLALGEFDQAWPDYEARWMLPDALPREYRAGVPYWTGEPSLAGKRILLFDEQGFGDAIQFARYAPALAERGGEVILECRPELRGLFATLRGPQAVNVRGTSRETMDFQTSLMSLPLALGKPFDAAAHARPYLAAAPERQAAWRERLAENAATLRIGLAWTGNPSFYGAREKSCPAAQVAMLLAQPGCTFVNLQIGAAAAELTALRETQAAFIDWTSELRNFAETAALIANLDLVVTIDTAVAHLAGALGKPVWVMLPHSADWRWMTDETRSPWYPSMRLYRQRRSGDWGEVVSRIRADLAGFRPETR